MSENKAIIGGEFIIRETKPEEIFIPEEWTEEQQMIAKMCDDSLAQEINPHLDRIDELEEGLMPSLLEKAGELGLLGLSVPQDLGGMEVDFKTTLLATERLGAGFSFSVAYGAHTGMELFLSCITETKSKRRNTFLNWLRVSGKLLTV